MRRSSLAIAILLATLASGCAFGTTVDCELSSTLTQADCDHAVQAALPQLPNENAAPTIVVRAGCPRDMHCPPEVDTLMITVEITFTGMDRLGVIAVNRTNWEASEPRYVPAPTS